MSRLCSYWDPWNIMDLHRSDNTLRCKSFFSERYMYHHAKELSSTPGLDTCRHLFRLFRLLSSMRQGKLVTRLLATPITQLPRYAWLTSVMKTRIENCRRFTPLKILMESDCSENCNSVVTFAVSVSALRTSRLLEGGDLVFIMSCYWLEIFLIYAWRPSMQRKIPSQA